MAIQKFALYDLIVDIIPGAILLVVLYSVAPTNLYKQFFGISPSLVPGVAVILFSYPVGRIVVHGISSKIENIILMIYTLPVKRLEYFSRDSSKMPRNISTEDQTEEGSENKEPSNKEQDENDDNLLENWFGGAGTIPSDVSLSVLKDVQNGLEDITGSETNTESLRRYGENILFPRDTLYGKYEILSTFFRHMTFISMISTGTYFIYLLLHLYSLPPQLVVDGSAPISDWPLALLTVLPLAVLAVFVLCLWRWIDWTKSRNRAFVNDLHSYLREQDIVNRDEKRNESSSADP